MAAKPSSNKRITKFDNCDILIYASALFHNAKRLQVICRRSILYHRRERSISDVDALTQFKKASRIKVIPVMLIPVALGALGAYVWTGTFHIGLFY